MLSLISSQGTALFKSLSFFHLASILLNFKYLSTSFLISAKLFFASLSPWIASMFVPKLSNSVLLVVFTEPAAPPAPGVQTSRFFKSLEI